MRTGNATSIFPRLRTGRHLEHLDQVRQGFFAEVDLLAVIDNQARHAQDMVLVLPGRVVGDIIDFGRDAVVQGRHVLYRRNQVRADSARQGHEDVQFMGR